MEFPYRSSWKDGLKSSSTEFSSSPTYLASKLSELTFIHEKEREKLTREIESLIDDSELKENPPRERSKSMHLIRNRGSSTSVMSLHSFDQDDFYPIRYLLKAIKKEQKEIRLSSDLDIKQKYYESKSLNFKKDESLWKQMDKHLESSENEQMFLEEEKEEETQFNVLVDLLKRATRLQKSDSGKIERTAVALDDIELDDVNDFKKNILNESKIHDPNNKRKLSSIFTSILPEKKIDRGTDFSDTKIELLTNEFRRHSFIHNPSEKIVLSSSPKNNTSYVPSQLQCPICKSFRTTILFELNLHVEDCFANFIFFQENNNSKDNNSHTSQISQSNLIHLSDGIKQDKEFEPIIISTQNESKNNLNNYSASSPISPTSISTSSSSSSFPLKQKLFGLKVFGKKYSAQVKTPLILGPVSQRFSKIPLHLDLSKSKFTNLQRSKRMKLLETTEKYKARVQFLLLESFKKLSDQRDKEQVMRKETALEFKKYASWGSKSLEKSFRKFAQIQIILSEVMQESEMIKIKLLHSKDEQLNNIIFKVNNGAPLIDLYNDKLVPINLLFEHPQLLKNTENVKSLQNAQKSALVEFVNMREKEKMVNNSTRAKKLTKIFQLIEFIMMHSSTEESESNLEDSMLHYKQEDPHSTLNRSSNFTGNTISEDEYFEPVDSIQLSFESFLGDQRYTEGQQFQSLVDTINDENNRAQLKPEDILDFMARFTTSTLTRLKLCTDDYAAMFELLSSRMLFPKITCYCDFYTLSPEILEAQKIFSKNAAILRTFPFSKLIFDIAPQFSDTLESEFKYLQHPIKLLQDLKFLSVPRDMIWIIQKVLLISYDLAFKILKKEIGADDLFPLFIICSILADDFHLYIAIRYLNDFLPQHQKMGELGYSLVTLEAAVAHISSLQLEQ